MLLLGGSALLSGIVDNIPYIVTIASQLGTDMGGGPDHVAW
jgi:Na+/H+ antiporter NhaD/arsenite permease-like protein